MVTIPGVRKTPWWDKEWLVELVASALPLFALSYSAWDKWPTGWGKLFLAAIGWVLVVAALKIHRARKNDRDRDQKESPADLLGCTEVLYQTIQHVFGTNAAVSRCRVTIHRVIPLRPGEQPTQQELEQVIPYVGGANVGGGKGRKFPIHAGIIGRAARTRQIHTGIRENNDHEKFIGELVEKWGYCDADARGLSPDRRSWMAVPISGPDKSVTGVVYLDSDEPEFFTDPVQKFVIDGCIGVANYVNERYK